MSPKDMSHTSPAEQQKQKKEKGCCGGTRPGCMGCGKCGDQQQGRITNARGLCWPF